MAGYARNRAPNMSAFMLQLNQIPEGHPATAASNQAASFASRDDDDLALFTNSQWYDESKSTGLQNQRLPPSESRPDAALAPALDEVDMSFGLGGMLFGPSLS